MNKHVIQYFNDYSNHLAANNKTVTQLHRDESFLGGDWTFQVNLHHLFDHSILDRATKEIGCAAVASIMVSPIVYIFDKTLAKSKHIPRSASRQFRKLLQGATKDMIKTPRQFFGNPSFRLTTAVYFGMYSFSNLSELAMDMMDISNIEEQHPQQQALPVQEHQQQREQTKMVVSSLAYMALFGWRDTVLAKRTMANTITTNHSVPLRTLSLFATRDAATMYATYFVAPMVTEYLQEEYNLDQSTAVEWGSAVGIPVLTQLATSPLHIHGMDCFTRPKAAIAERLAIIGKEFQSVSFARGFRILPALSIGSFSNNHLREHITCHD